jgi:long-chain fatty acid transport protein
MRKGLALALTVGIVAVPGQVMASGFQLIEQNGSGLGNAFAGQAAGVSDPSAIFYNPAAMTRLKGKHFSLALSGIGIGNEFTDTGSTSPASFVTKGGTGGDPGGWAPVPNAYLTWELTPSVWFGFGVNAPFGLKTEWDADWLGRFHGIKSDIKTYNFAPTLAFKVNDNLSFGAGASIQQLSANLTKSVAYGAIGYGSAAAALAKLGLGAYVPIFAAANAAVLGQEGVAEIDGTKWGFGFNVGALLSLGDATHIGVDYRSKTKYTLDGTATFSARPTFVGPGPLAAVATAVNAGFATNFADGAVTADIELPDTFSVAVDHKADKLEVMADWTWTGWSSIQELAIVRAGGSTLSSEPLKFESTWRAGLGVNYQVNDNFKLRLGYAYDKAPVQDAYRTPRLPDADRNWAAAGFQYKVGQNGAVDFGFAHIFIKEAASNLPSQDTPTSAPAGKLIGSYKGTVNILSLQFHQSF